MTRRLRVVAPSDTSRLYPVVADVLAHTLVSEPATASKRRSLVRQLTSGDVLINCRGTDAPLLVARGLADIGLTGYDMAVEAVLATGQDLEIRSLAPARASFVCYATVPGRTSIRRLYTEYPHTAARWARSTRGLHDVEVIPLHGSLEGLAREDPDAAAFVLVTTGETLEANGLLEKTPLIATDLCLVRRRDDSAEFDGLAMNSLPLLALPDFCAETAR